MAALDYMPLSEQRDETERNDSELEREARAGRRRTVAHLTQIHDVRTIRRMGVGE